MCLSIHWNRFWLMNDKFYCRSDEPIGSFFIILQNGSDRRKASLHNRRAGEEAQ